MQLATADYAVTVVILLIPLAIGIFYAWKDSKRVNREEYLLGGREMSMLPVSFSIFVTYQSAISLIGTPSEIYQYGPMILIMYIGIAASYVIGCYTMVPLMYPLQLTSIFEYLEMRYESPAVRMLGTIIGMLQTFFYMVIAMLAPGLAVQAAIGIPFWMSVVIVGSIETVHTAIETIQYLLFLLVPEEIHSTRIAAIGIPFWMSVVIVGSIGTLYTAIGGIKSVIWTDAFQTTIVFIGIVILMVRGTMVVGGVQNVWNIAEAGGRTSLREISPDPRTRHTWWSMLIGGCFTWLTNIFNQSTLQRLSSMKSIESAKRSFLLNAPSNFLFGLLLVIVGIILYAYFYVIRCDPVKNGAISNPNQLILFFLLHALQDTPGLAGLYMATIFSGALSTLSSGINALACNTVEDVLRNPLRAFSEKTITVLCKVLVFVYGFTILGVTYHTKSLQGPVTQMAASVFGACGSANLGMFVMASTVPWANKYGAFAGGLLTLVMNIWIVLGSRLYGKRHPTLPSPPTDQCHIILNQTTAKMVMPPASNVTSSYIAVSHITTVAEESSEAGFFLYDISYEWYSLFGTSVCCVITLIVSKFTKSLTKSRAGANLIFPFQGKSWGLGETLTTSAKN